MRGAGGDVRSSSNKALILWSLHFFYLQGRRAERAQLARDLRLMHAYRERSKAEGITHILSQAITIHHTLYATLGTAEYLEYVLRNPFNTPQTVTIYSEDPELRYAGEGMLGGVECVCGVWCLLEFVCAWCYIGGVEREK